MKSLKALQHKLFQSYDNLQEKFKDYYVTGLSTNEVYNYKNKSMTCNQTFSEDFLINKDKYHEAFTQYIQNKNKYNHQVYTMFWKNLDRLKLWKHNCQINKKFSDIVKKHRTFTMQVEYDEEVRKTRKTVHNFTSLVINEQLNKLLGKGPNFIPTKTDTTNNFNDTYKNRIFNTLSEYSKKETNMETYNHTSNMALKFNLNCPELTREARTYMIDILEKTSLTCYEKQKTHLVNSNITELEYNDIQHLAKNPKIIINTADKNLGLSINSVEWYVQEYERQLNDEQIYTQIPYNEIENIIINGIKDLSILHKKYSKHQELKRFDLDLLIQREANSVQIPTLNISPKVHKLKEEAHPSLEPKLKGRPIVNGFATLNTEPSKLLGSLFRYCLNECIKKAQSEGIHSPIINSSREVVDKLNRISFKNYKLDNIYFITYDFSSLYTSISKNTLFDTIHFIGDFLKLEKNLIFLMKDLFNYIKNNAYFTVGNTKLYLQKEGFAMGSYDSADGANLVLFKSEYFMAKTSNINRFIVDFNRFIDDGSMIVYTEHGQIKEFVSKLASYYPKELEIEFTVNKFKADFLDLTYGIGHTTYMNGRGYHYIYQKKFNTYSYTNFQSNHPNGVFKGIICTECHRYNYLSSTKEEYKHICKLFIHRLIKCGYPKEYIQKHMIQYRTEQKTKHYKTIKNYTRCKLNFNKLYDNEKLLKRIFHSKNNKVNTIRLCNTTMRKLRTILLTKKKLHKKIESNFKKNNTINFHDNII